MNRSELEALLASKAPAPTGSAKESYAYLLSLMQAEEVDLDELKLHLDTLGRMREKMDDESKDMVVMAMRAICQKKDFPEKLRSRVESQKRVVWQDFHEKDPIEAVIATKLAYLDGEKPEEAARWLKENKDMLPPAPVIVVPKITLR